MFNLINILELKSIIKNMENKQVQLVDIAKVFLTIGTIGFGGWGAIVSLMQEYCVNQRKWLSLDELTHGVALGQFLGPFALNAAIFIGYRVRGFAGGVVSLVSFLLPSVVFVIIISSLYVRYHEIPSLQLGLKSLSPVVIALILVAAYQMGKAKIKSFEPIVLVAMTVFLSVYFKVQVMAILLAALMYGFIKVKVFKMGGNNEN